MILGMSGFLFLMHCELCILPFFKADRKYKFVNSAVTCAAAGVQRLPCSAGNLAPVDNRVFLAEEDGRAFHIDEIVFVLDKCRVRAP